jgi:hypothetical protein
VLLTLEEKREKVQEWLEIRKNEGLNIKEAADKIGFSDCSLYNWAKEVGIQMPSQPSQGSGVKVKKRRPREPHLVTVPLESKFDESKKQLIKTLIQNIESSIQTIKSLIEG